MTRVRAAALAAAAGAILACASATGRRPAPPDPDLRIWVPPILRWDAGTGREVEFAIENGTNRTLEVPPPDPAAAGVAIYVDAGGEGRACGVEPSPGPPAGTVRLGPGDALPVRVDLEEACGDLPPGEYRYELSYRAPRASGGTLALATRYGTLVVDGAQRAGRRPAAPAPRRPSARAP
jgi:hypothetical protein